MNSTLISRNVTIRGRRTSLRLERQIWNALDEICQRERITLHELCMYIESQRRKASRTSAVRTFALMYFHAAATEQGHIRAGHGKLASKIKKD
ncbi:MAG: ribbon-helix-helix domain-containing protein [Rhodospirillales bacterium]